eukprot:221696-Rhodomonas_salina.2
MQDEDGDSNMRTRPSHGYHPTPLLRPVLTYATQLSVQSVPESRVLMFDCAWSVAPPPWPLVSRLLPSPLPSPPLPLSGTTADTGTKRPSTRVHAAGSEAFNAQTASLSARG